MVRGRGFDGDGIEERLELIKLYSELNEKKKRLCVEAEAILSVQLICKMWEKVVHSAKEEHVKFTDHIFN